jgi:hypothetical protein
LKASKAGSILWPPAKSSEAEKFDHYSLLLGIVGHTVKVDTPVLIGMRGIELRAQQTHAVRSTRSYDDAFVLLELQPDGAKHVREFSGATHPYQRRSGQAPNVNARSCRVRNRMDSDVGMIRPGIYYMRRTKQHHGRPALVVTTQSGSGRIPAYRDTNHDGQFFPQEMRKSVLRVAGCQVQSGIGDYAEGILFHPGFTAQHGNNANKRYSSIGCQTAGEADVNVLVSTRQRKGAIIYYLFDAVSLIDGLHRTIRSGIERSPATVVTRSSPATV